MLLVRHVGVSHRFTCAEAADGHPVLNHVGHDIDLRMALYKAAARFLHRRPIEFAEEAAECNKVFDGKLLVRKPNDEILEPYTMDLVEIPIAQARQLDIL